MKTPLFLLLLIAGTASFAQSAKKLNQQLLAELVLEQQKQDSASVIFSKSYSEVSSLKEQLMEKSKELQKGIKTIRRTNEEVQQLVNLLGMLGENVDVSKLNKYGNLPDSVNKLKPVENLIRGIKPFETVPGSLSLEGLKRSEQNELLKEKLLLYRNTAQENESRLKSNQLIQDRLKGVIPQVDSVISMLKKAHEDALVNKTDLEKQVETLKENYRLKGPKGFSSEYQRLFPEIHPVPEKKTSNTGTTNATTRAVRDNHNPFTSGSSLPKNRAGEEKVPRDEEVILEIVDEPATFPGGMSGLKRYLDENIQYPQKVLDKEIQGKVYLQFVVSENGFISNVKVKKGMTDCPECDQEAIRVVKAMPKWIPAKSNGVTVHSLYSLPIIFRVN